MKKIFGILFALILCISLVAVTAAAAEPTAVLTSEEPVYAGDLLEVSFAVEGNNIIGVEGQLVFDAAQLTLKEIIPAVSASWELSYNRETNRFLADGNDFNAPLSGTQVIFKAIFEVAALNDGTNIRVSCTNIIMASATEEFSVADAVCSTTVSADRPTGTDCSLKDISVAGGSLSPVFSSDITSYVVYLPNEITAANITALASDKYASVTVDGPDLLAAETYNEYKITCTAENGAQKVYTLLVWRAPAEMLHEHTYGAEIVEPSCTGTGYTAYVCSCGHSYQSNVKDPTGHTYGDWETTKEATVKAEGQQMRKCACGAEETRPIAKVSKNADTGKVVLTIVLIIVGVLVGCGIVAGVLFYLNIHRTGKFLQKKKKDEE